ncbi:MAG TPA: DNA oxidative demethylase AlkB [Stellaceae bacterium]|jgi:alkylated DNA repair protein (DNA oxidative demethylase)|nr:DNA oxidative demethylase AlkB [Stellaceae bacterium]
MTSLFSALDAAPIVLTPGMVLLPGWSVRHRLDEALINEARHVMAAAPPRRMTTPGGQKMSAALTNCGPLGWVSDRAGYRYEPTDPLTGRPWPAMPATFMDLASRAAAEAGFDGFAPEACLINLYHPGSRMGAHRDQDEAAPDQPIVSVSLGVDAVFRVGGLARGGPTRSVRLVHGDIVVFGGPARFVYHGIDRLGPEPHPILGPERINLTFRRVTPAH